MTGAAALIVAGGRGVRAGGALPKQYLRLGRETLLRRTVGAFLAHPGVSAIRVVIHPDDQALYAASVEGLGLLPPAFGGAARQDSVRLGLRSLVELDPEFVLIHDAARPFVPAAMVSRVLAALASTAAAIPALPVVDTIKRAASGRPERVAATVERDGLWRAQTPQGFRFRPLLDAHDSLAGRNLTDDAAVAEAAGLEVAIVEGDEDNMKLTTRDDFRRAERRVTACEVRVGSGFDVHRFGEGDHVTLCGVKVPHDHGLKGHSDADVGLHALTDALLGAIGEGDIGSHFPPSESRWRGADSAIFVCRARELIAEAGGVIVNADVTFLCERPKILPHRRRMIETVARLLGVDEGRISIKATTTEGLGFTGRREGIAAQAIVSINLSAERYSERRFF